jgi:hypothetical protein
VGPHAQADAYPGTMLVTAAVATQGLSPTDATNYASLLRYVAGDGQQPGEGSGQLAAGYLPMTAANGLGKLAAYTKAAATAVAEQKGFVPPVTGSDATGPARIDATPTPASARSSVSAVHIDPPAAVTAPSSPAVSAVVPPAQAPVVARPDPTVTAELASGVTSAASVGVASQIVPTLLLVLLLGGLALLAMTYGPGRVRNKS